MGQRFKIIVKQNNQFRIYHIQWLWGMYAIRRIGTAVRNYLNYHKENYQSFENFLYGSFFGKPSDMNSIYRYFYNVLDDNEEIFQN